MNEKVPNDAAVSTVDRLPWFLGMLRSCFVQRNLVPFGIKDDYSEAFQAFCVEQIDKIIPTLDKSCPENQDR